MKPINLYSLTLPLDKRFSFMDLFEQQLSDRECKKESNHWELLSLRAFVEDVLLFLDVEKLNGFYYSFTIPQIAKEFDLLKFSDDKILNIELKGAMIEKERIRKQLLQNRHYLHFQQKEILSYCYVADQKIVYTLDAENKLTVVPLECLITKIDSFGAFYDGDVEKLFRVRDFLVSPFDTPDRFIRGEYFLTDQQELFKRKIITENARAMNKKRPYFCQIKGRPGTGKTLLLYDIGKEFAKEYRVCMLHCAEKISEFEEINRRIKNFCIRSIKDFRPEDLAAYDVFVLDEAHRIDKESFMFLLNEISQNKKACIIGSDSEQMLSKDEILRNMPAVFDGIKKISVYKLSNRIRTNSELADFTAKLFDRQKRIATKHFANVEILYAKSFEEAQTVIDAYEARKYVFLCNTETQSDTLKGNLTVQDAIGREYDRVIVTLDNNFRYAENGQLVAAENPNTKYIFPKLFYQCVTRAREKLAIVIIDNDLLFEQVLRLGTR